MKTKFRKIVAFHRKISRLCKLLITPGYTSIRAQMYAYHRIIEGFMWVIKSIIIHQCLWIGVSVSILRG